MDTIFRGVRPGDAALAALLTAVGVAMNLTNMAGPSDGMRIDSTSWTMIPVLALATLPILWRRRDVLLVTAASTAAIAVHVLAYGWVVRCGAGLLLAFALAYSVGRLSAGARSGIGLVAVIGLQALVLVRDSAAGFEMLPVTIAITVVAWGVGTWLRSRTTVQLERGEPRVGTYA